MISYPERAHLCPNPGSGPPVYGVKAVMAHPGSRGRGSHGKACQKSASSGCVRFGVSRFAGEAYMCVMCGNVAYRLAAEHRRPRVPSCRLRRGEHLCSRQSKSGICCHAARVTVSTTSQTAGTGLQLHAIARFRGTVTSASMSGPEGCCYSGNPGQRSRAHTQTHTRKHTSTCTQAHQRSRAGGAALLLPHQLESVGEQMVATRTAD